MLEFLRQIRGLFNRFSAMEVFGVHIDWVFHLIGAAAIVFVARRYLAERRVVLLTIGLLVAKELFDVFAKTRLEYIRAPGLDLLFDMTAGLVGLALGLWLARRRDRRTAAESGAA